ncbi:MAG: histidine phosphatase family protein [Gammaproteobacteria bacterium]|nr:histidine phosphatase family protein [Gammaproteobacteria bacterium]
MSAKRARKTPIILTMGICLLLNLSAVSADDGFWQQLRDAPNRVVVMRNAESRGNVDGTDMLAWDASGNCAGESTLTATGREQARRIGAAFAKRGIEPLAISSPMCRCSETAEIAFGHVVSDPALRQRHPEDSQGQEAFLAAASTLLTRYRGERPIVFVNHRPNIDALTMELLDIGELLVGEVTEDGEIEVIDRIRMAD